MAVPDTNTFSQQDVETELGGITDLQACFTASVDSAFDATYKGSKNSLYNFRNYGAVRPPSYGYLYNAYTYTDANFAPYGWHVPSLTEINALITVLGGDSVAGGKMKWPGTGAWNAPNTGADNSSGLSKVGSGYRFASGNYLDERDLNMLALVTEIASGVYYTSTLLNATAAISTTLNAASSRFGISVMLLKNDSTDPSTMTDYDGNIYDTIKIGTQVWTVQNWKCTKLNNGTLIPTVTNATTWAALTTGAKCAYDNDENNV